MERTCRIANCTRIPPLGRLCAMHQTRLWRHGNPDQDHTPADEFVVDVTVSDRRPVPGMRPVERRAACARLTNLGLSAAEIADIFNVTERTVHRWRAAAPAALHRLTPAA